MADLLTIRPEARDEWRTLVAALGLLEAAGRSTPCQSDPDPFGSDERIERREAAVACSGCPLLEVCDEFATANSETANVWGGSDRTVHPQTSRRRRRAATGVQGGGGVPPREMARDRRTLALAHTEPEGSLRGGEGR